MPEPEGEPEEDAVGAGEDAEEDEPPLLHPVRASAAATATAPAAGSRTWAAFGPVGRGPAGTGRVCSFLRLTWLPPIRHHAEGAGMRARKSLSAFHRFVRFAGLTRPKGPRKRNTPGPGVGPQAGVRGRALGFAA
ncbi:hypothetical protein GCM10018790_26500 [Kitasatospora xanthocidica]|nr:hypothetical protein GCM10018790_26500 [Kitasatospora xanthocidica]